MLAGRSWKIKYTPEDGDLVRLFYIPALEDAERYDRLTGYFNAGALALAARGIEGLVRNGGHMRLIVGCTLEPPEIEAIEKGAQLRDGVEQRLLSRSLAPPDPESSDALELLAWMVASGHLDVKVAVPCDIDGKPVHDNAIFHEKTGIIEDRAGDRIAWTGSLNETAAGWRRNWGEHQRLYRLGPRTGAGRQRGGQLRAALGRQGAACDRARRARGGAPGLVALHARRHAQAPQGFGHQATRSSRRCFGGDRSRAGAPRRCTAYRPAKPCMDIHQASARS